MSAIEVGHRQPAWMFGDMKTSSKVWIFLIVIGVLAALFFGLTGIYVIQPIGAIPDGISILYFRLGLNLPYFSSADCFLMDNVGSVSLLSRAAAMGQILELIEDRIIVRLPYMDFVYRISMKGVTLEWPE